MVRCCCLQKIGRCGVFARALLEIVASKFHACLYLPMKVKVFIPNSPPHPPHPSRGYLFILFYCYETVFNNWSQFFILKIYKRYHMKFFFLSNIQFGCCSHKYMKFYSMTLLHTTKTEGS